MMKVEWQMIRNVMRSGGWMLYSCIRENKIRMKELTSLFDYEDETIGNPFVKIVLGVIC